MRAAAVLTTVGTEEQANLIAGELVARGLAACVNVVPGVRSVYRWQGEVVTDGELLLVAKIREEDFEAVRAAIRELHSYDQPEVLALPVSAGDPGYLAWIAEVTDRGGDG